MSDILAGTRTLLWSWGRWGQTANIGLPRLSPMFGERALKTPLYSGTDGPPEMLAVDRAVCKIDPAERNLLIERYQWRTPLRIVLNQRCLTKWKYLKCLESAEWAVHVKLQDS